MTYYRMRHTDGFTISVDYGYDTHQISISAAEWKRICAGKPVQLAGHGFNCEGDAMKDSWEINVGRPGGIRVGYGVGGEIYDGSLSDTEVLVADQQGRVVKQPSLPA